ncbi:hypothetical protein [Metabacillus fastidiosus]|uniref:hypothetical protein n=1 Tax=Metabacillus fastidiosus TaxID=1458 RepID=UPI003D27488D
MEFINEQVPDVSVITDEKGYELAIKSIQYLDEKHDRVHLRCAEHMPIFKRGFVCDLACHYTTVNQAQEEKQEYVDAIRDLVLVYINKSWDIQNRPVFEYIFFK